MNRRGVAFMPYPARFPVSGLDVGWAEQERMGDVRVVPLARQEAGMPLICVETLSRNIRRSQTPVTMLRGGSALRMRLRMLTRGRDTGIDGVVPFFVSSVFLQKKTTVKAAKCKVVYSYLSENSPPPPKKHENNRKFRGKQLILQMQIWTRTAVCEMLSPSPVVENL